MPLNVSYMGTKRRVAHRVARIVDAQASGPYLDLFTGMCAVSTAINCSRAVWCNDVQTFAASVATAFFTSPPLSCDSDQAPSLALMPFRQNRAQLRLRFAAELGHERLALASGCTERVRSLEGIMPNVAVDEVLDGERKALAARPFRPPYRLFSITYSGGYFGLEQSIDIDSIRFAIDQLRDDDVINAADHRWLCLALCQAVSKVATTTGHFAQHMRANDRNLARYVAQRRRSVWTEWQHAIFENHPIGTAAWRAGNRVFRQDATTLLDELKSSSARPAVVYADPPYTRDQYSRYYHIYETLLKYDYPVSAGSGRYRPDRFRSPFSMKTRVEQAVQTLIAGCSKLGSALVLSYPEHGLLPSSEKVVQSLISKHYGRPPVIHSFAASHSSFGASKGRQKYDVHERIYVAH
ncbi:MAG: DNA adenine methylase [Gammaproteobacteria bacterium]|nr:DNA adenine methylase [Gammaproteobacteria bacterium]